MQLIQHRVNTIAQLDGVRPEYGVELDLRDRCSRLILQHDPFADGEDFAPYLRRYRHGTMILNVKSERIEHRVLAELEEAGTVRDYFFLDCSFPMIRQLVGLGQRRIAEFAEQLRRFPADAVCTKRPDLWQAALAAGESA